ncbi:ribonuclease HII [Mycoplasma putrefaciens]|uniref:Ribonuclease HII n=1 Tax=Mycoplasma putrefaciens Mput9231 TaxID=1292033 RepID=M9W9J9_9MOLU|nr:ribonuclease HII [Mycoplasma putrefaciens]AGJ90683.1 Ribonuclease H II [Mycoplasma putrefaciens Mput9231]
MISRKEFDNTIKQKYNVKLISGSDESGRGCIAGPLVAASVILKDDYFNSKIKDSKLLSSKLREQLFDEIINNCLAYQIRIVSAKQVDQLNPLQASLQAIQQTIQKLKIKPELALIDGNKNIDLKDYKSICIIKGDDKSFSISCASILAKVTRDKILNELSLKYPMYGFDKHKGYCTQFHLQAVKKYGVIENVHRKSYKPILQILNNSKN